MECTFLIGFLCFFVLVFFSVNMYFSRNWQSVIHLGTHKLFSLLRIRESPGVFVRFIVATNWMQMWSLANLSVGYAHSP